MRWIKGLEQTLQLASNPHLLDIHRRLSQTVSFRRIDQFGIFAVTYSPTRGYNSAMFPNAEAKA